MEKSALRLVAPTEVFRTVPIRKSNSELRTREHLTADAVETLIEAAKANRYGHRDATMILVAFRRGLRAAEVCDLRWDQVDFNGAVLHVSGQPGSQCQTIACWPGGSLRSSGTHSSITNRPPRMRCRAALRKH